MERPMRHGGDITLLSIVVAMCALPSAPVTCDARPASKPNRVHMADVLPVDAAHQPTDARLKRRRNLERSGVLLSFLRWPKPLPLEVVLTAI